MDGGATGGVGVGVGGRRLSRSLLLSTLVLAAAAGGPRSRALAVLCDTTATATTTVRVEDVAGARLLNETVSCSNGGQRTAVWAGAVVLDAAIVIGDGTFLSIAGEDQQAEAQGGLDTRMFVVSAGGGLSLSELRLSGGMAATGGGGAIHAYDANLTLDDCVFDGNGAGNGHGGAVFVERGVVSIVGGAFLRNNASENGGAVHVIDADLNVRGGTVFEHNSAVQGGALYATGVNCSLDSATFLSNKATDRGGALAHFLSNANVTASVFTSNWAQHSAGAVFGGPGSPLAVDGGEFRDNVTPSSGGAISASTSTFRGGTVLAGNSAGDDGGGINAWDRDGSLAVEGLVCEKNTAVDNGGCIYAVGTAVLDSGTVMRDNVAYEGGCIYASSDSTIVVDGGTFSCEATRNGGFLFVQNGARANITDGLVSNNVAGRRGAAVYCNGGSVDAGGPSVFIKGGTFANNEALEVGGAIVAWGGFNVVSISGGVFENNSARFYGGFIFVELEASVLCEGAMIRGNSAGDQGGGIYARDAAWVTSTCDLIGNEAPQGAGAYLTYVENATFGNMEVAGNVLASGGSAVFITASAVSATKVGFESGDTNMLHEGATETTRAIQLDDNSTFVCKGCVFDGWLGDAVVVSANPANGSLVLDSCDFSGSSAAMAVISAYSDAEIRNAVVGDQTLVNAQNLVPLRLVDRALECADPNACGEDGECVDSALGVLCECLPQSDECLDDGGTISFTLTSPPDSVTYSPSAVAFNLLVSAADDGTTYVIWALDFDADDLSLTVVPSSGILHPGGNATVTVTGTPIQEDVGGVMTSRFVLTSVGSGDDRTPSSQIDSGMTALNVSSAFYLCPAFQYALPVDGDGGDVNFECRQCTGVEGSEGVDCEKEGATLASLPIRDGYWRSSKESLVILSCLNSEACAGATEVSTPDDYCAVGYKGLYCAVCAEGYGQGVGRSCHSCEKSTTKAGLLIAVAAAFCLAILLFLLFGVVFLIGGLDAVGSIRRSMASSLAVLPTSTSLKLSRFTSASSAPREPVSASSPGSNRLSQDFSRRSRGSSAVGDVPVTESPPRPTNDFNIDREVVISGARSAVVTVPAHSRLLGLSRVDSTNYDTSGISSRGPEHSMSVRSRADTAVGNDRGGGDGDSTGCCGVTGAKMKIWASRLPLDKFKILVVVWQILTVFPSITGVEYPPTYSRFLSWIDVVNLDLGQIFSASCLLPSVSFYERLLATTLVPIALVGVLVYTYYLARRRAGIGLRGVAALGAAWSRHMAAGLMLTFLVFTSTSTIVFKTFACDNIVVEGESYLREDYRLSCKSTTHTYFMMYAGVMIVLYPVGIPLLYFFILWKNRHSLNPSVGANAEAAEHDHPESAGTMAPTALSPELARELEERIKMRKQNPDLVPSMFLWKDFGPDLYYYEVIECGRRILLTGVLIFIDPYSPAQAAIACIFAFGSLLGFELLRPHLDPADSWLYRLGCVVIFLSNFLALLIKVDAAGEGKQDALGGLLVAINVFLVLAVLFTSWFATQQQVDDSLDESAFVTMAKRVAVTERSTEHPRENLTRVPRSHISFAVEPMGPELTHLGTNVSVVDGPRQSTAGVAIDRSRLDSADEVKPPRYLWSDASGVAQG